MGFSLKEKIKAKKSLIFDIVLLMLLGLLSLTWFKGPYLISGGDLGLPFDRLRYLSLMFSTWDETVATGLADYRQVASLIPYALWGGITEFFHLSLVFWEKSLFYIWFAGSGISMYYLCSVLKMRRVGKIFAAIFYMLNPFSLIVIWHVPHALIQMPYAFAPLYLGLYINGLQNKKGIGYIILAVLIWLFTTTSAYAWPAAAVLHWLPILLYGIILFILHPRSRRFIFKFTSLFFLFWLLFNFYWIFPFATSLSESLAAAEPTALMSTIDTLRLTSVKPFEAIRMFGFWSLHAGYKGEPYYSFEAFYRYPAVMAISWLIPILTFLGFLNKDFLRKPLVFFSFLMIVFGFAFMGGPYTPFWETINLIYQSIPGLALVTRFNFLFFGIPVYLIFSFLFGYGISLIFDIGYRKIKELIVIPLGILAILLFVVLVFPFWNGEVIRSEGKLWPGERVKVPDYWWEAKEWLSTQSDFFRIFPLPMSKIYNVAFDWEMGYSGGDISRWFTSQPVLNANIGVNFKIPEMIGGVIEKRIDFKDLGKILGYLNVKYLWVREDIRWDFLRGHSWWFNHNLENINEFIGRQKDLKLVKEFDKLKFYQIDEKYFLPHLYIPQKMAVVNGESESLVDIATFLSPQEREAVLFINPKNKENTDINVDSQYLSQIFSWQNPSLLTTGEMEYISLDEAVEFLPVVRFNPDSPLYFLIRLKESLIRVFASSGEKINNEITFSSKRLREIYQLLRKVETKQIINENYYLFKDKDNLYLNQTILRVIKSWEEISKEIASLKNIEEQKKSLDKAGEQALLQEIFIESFKRELGGSQNQDLIKNTEKLGLILDEKRKKTFKASDLILGTREKIDNQKVSYDFQTYEDDEYEILLRNDGILKYYQFPENKISFKIDGGETKTRMIDPSQEGPVSLGKEKFIKGSHQILLLTPPQNSLISDPSFEQGVWSGAKSIPVNLLSEISTERVADVAAGKSALKVSSKKGNAIVFAPINNYKLGDIYRISFAAKHLEGEAPTIGIWENDNESPIPSLEISASNPFGSAENQTNFNFFKELPSDNKWRYYEFFFKPSPETQSIGLAFFAQQSKIGGETVNLYDDVKLERVFTNPMLLKISLDQKPREVPEIDFKRINKTQYQINIKNAQKPFYLVFSESFHPSWNLSIENEKLLINNFANGWYIRKTGDYQITLSFEKQKIYYFSGGISLLTFLLSIIYLLVKRKNEK